MSDDYPLYPTLSELGKIEAQQLMNNFKSIMKGLVDETLRSLYCDVAVHIESDSWTNFGNEILDGLTDYGNRHKQSKTDFKKIRQAIYKEHKDDIVEDLNQDLVKENEDLKKHLKLIQEMNVGRY